MYTGRGLLKLAARTSMAVPAPEGVSNGNLIVVLVMVEDGAVTVACPKGTVLASTVLSSTFTQVAIGIVHDGSSTYEVTWGGSSEQCQAASFGFSGRGGTFLHGGAWQSGTSTTPTATGLTLPTAGYDLICLMAEGAAKAATPPAGMTERLDGTGSEGEVFAQHAATQDGAAGGATGTRAFAYTGSSAWRAILIGMPPAAAAEGKGSGTGTGSGSASGTRGRVGKGTGQGGGAGSAKGTRGNVGGATGSGAGSGEATGDAVAREPVKATRVLSEPVDDTLFVEVRHVEGGRSRWSGVESDPGNIAQQIKTATGAPGGHIDASMSLTRDPRRDWPDLNLGDEVVIRGRIRPLGRNAFEGMLQQFPSQLGDGYSIGANAVGHQVLLTEDETCRWLFARLGFDGWNEPQLWRREEINNGGYPQGKIPVNVGNGGLSWEVPSESINNMEHSEAWWEAPAGVKVSALGYRGKQSGDTGKFQSPRVQAFDAESANGTDKVETLMTLDDTPRVATISPARRRLMLQMLFSAPTTSPGSPTQRSFSELAEYGDTGVPLRDVSGQLPGVYFHDALAHILSTGAPDLDYTVRGDGSIIPNTSFVMQDFAPLGPGTAKEAIEKGNAYFLNNWGVFDDKQFFWRPWDPDRLTWNASIAGRVSWTPVGRQVFGLINGIEVVFTDAAGVSRTAGPPGSGCDYEDASLADSNPNNPYTRRGRRRWARLDVGFPLPYPTSAFQLGGIVLAESSAPQRSGTLVVRPLGAGHIPSITHPTIGPVPLWAVWAGDYMRLPDWPDPEPFRVIEASYDEPTKTLTAQLDSGAARLSAILERTGSRMSLIGG